MNNPDSKIHGAYMRPTWGRQDPGGPLVGPMNLAIREVLWNACYMATGKHLLTFLICLENIMQDVVYFPST